jgi:hypothetical protein
VHLVDFIIRMPQLTLRAQHLGTGLLEPLFDKSNLVTGRSVSINNKPILPLETLRIVSEPTTPQVPPSLLAHGPNGNEKYHIDQYNKSDTYGLEDNKNTSYPKITWHRPTAGGRGFGTTDRNLGQECGVSVRLPLVLSNKISQILLYYVDTTLLVNKFSKFLSRSNELYPILINS